MRALHQVSDLLHALLIAALAIPLQACLVVVSTESTSVEDANIIVVVFDDDDSRVSGATVIVTGTDRQWSQRGDTDSEGVYRCRVASGVTHVRITLEPPQGYVLARGRAWPVTLDVESGGSQQVDLPVVRSR